MPDYNSYVGILIESLQQKKIVLSALVHKNEEQANLIKEENLDLDAFDKNTNAKADLISKLELLDNGFATVYDRVRVELVEHKNQHKIEIESLQTLISEITDLSIAIQASEARNKQMLEQYFAQSRKQLKNNRVSVKVANDYYRNMSQMNYIDPQLLDRKK